jgi:oligoendopeptidase F
MKSNSESQSKIVSRKKISVQFRWDVESLYADTSDWERDCQRVEQLRYQLLKYKENFTRDVHSFLRCLQLRDKISVLIQSIYTYAHMRKDEDNNNDSYQSIFYRASGLMVNIEESLSFIDPGILSLDRNRLQEWMRENIQLSVYRHYLEDIFRKKGHILSPDEERIIAQAGEMAMIPENSFSMLSHADLRFSRVKDKEGKSIPISHGNFISLLKNKDRDFRKMVFKRYYQPYHQHRNTFAALLAGNLKKDRFYSKIRRYKNSLESALFEDNIPVSVYENLLDTVHKNIHLLHYYIQLKKEFLHLDPFHMYDIHLPLSEEMVHINYPEALSTIIHGLAPLGKSYLSVIKKGLRERWVDVYENKGKTSGAYSTGSYQGKPFILLNYQGTLEDVYTLAHELGHSLHSYYSNKNQPFIYSGYSIFLAEIASTTNEALLTNYLLARAQNKIEKLTILNHFLEQFRTTLFRQALLAEYERIIHIHDEKGESLTADWFSRQYADLNRYYYGNNVIVDKEVTLEWARIPHFYYHYYVYQYVTGFAAAIAISRKILQEGQPAVQKYLEFLCAGCSDYPITVLKQAGIDMTTGKPLEEAMKLFGELLAQLENIKKEK